VHFPAFPPNSQQLEFPHLPHELVWVAQEEKNIAPMAMGTSSSSAFMMFFGLRRMIDRLVNRS
jgi:hypothetical protein